MNEVGGHRIQRCPPTEKKGRVHTSTVTVAVYKNGSYTEDDPKLMRSDADFEIQWFSGTGPGGQNRNKTQNCCRVIHIPTGIKQEIQGRDRKANLRDAFKALHDLLDSKLVEDANRVISDIKKDQFGSGMRGDKRRTYRYQDEIISDHITNKKAKLSKIMKGNFDLLW